MSITHKKLEGSNKTTCVVTLHGIGFQQPPDDKNDIPGYADDLHDNLRKYLSQHELSDDPHRSRGPIYIESNWPSTPTDTQGTLEEGLARLGNWNPAKPGTINTADAPLVTAKQSLTHIALVYSNLEDRKPTPSVIFIVGMMVVGALFRYTTLTGLLQLVRRRAKTKFAHHVDAPSASLRVRHDSNFQRPRPTTTEAEGNVMTILHQLQSDVATYVCHEEQRERVQTFVREALLRLASRDDVESIIINSHSNGTVIALDVIRQLPPFVAAKVKMLITAGSPLRKYVALFRWGQHFDSIDQFCQCEHKDAHALPYSWYNFWDREDLVADPLEPSIKWRKGNQVPEQNDPKLFMHTHLATGACHNIYIIDKLVDNMQNSPVGGLQAHNYWDNDKEFVSELAKILQKVSTMHQPVPPADPHKKQSMILHSK